MSNQKAELVDGALGYLVAHGIANVSLRPMAAALGTSARMLLFYFQSKEGLLRAVFDELHGRLHSSFLEEAGTRASATPCQPIKRFWDWAIRDENSAYLRLLYEAQVTAAQNPAEYGRYLQRASADWQALALDLLSESLRCPAMATLCIAVFDGLFLEFMSTSDRERLSEALDLFVEMISKSAPSRLSR